MRREERSNPPKTELLPLVNEGSIMARELTNTKEKPTKIEEKNGKTDDVALFVVVLIGSEDSSS
jgi:glutamate mutase epsilon subunit